MKRIIEITFSIIAIIIFLSLILQLNSVPDVIKSNYVLGATISLIPVIAVLRLKQRKRYQRRTNKADN